MPQLRENRQSMRVLDTMDTKPAHQASLRYSPGPKLMARFSHLVAKPKATPLLPGENIHDADAGWLAAAGSASADAAVENAADISIHTHSRQEGAQVSPENADGDVC